MTERPAHAAPIGVVGVGNMGLAMTRRLLDRGHPVVVRDVRAEAEASAMAAGATTAPDCAALAQRCALLIVAVVDAAQCDAVLFGEGGACHGLHTRSAVMVCSTIGPPDVESIAARLAGSNVPCIDAPMSGGPARARDGTMSLMVACPDAVFARLLAGAITLSFFTYAVVNMGMVSGVLPVVGIPLPFISYGGTAMVTLGLGLGLLMSIARSRPLMQS